MKETLKCLGWIEVVLGVLAIIGAEGDYYAFVGGVLFLVTGWVALQYIKETEK